MSMNGNDTGTRVLRHRRQVICQGYERDDGLWDIEARLLDTKPQAINLPERGDLAPLEPIHEMGLRITLDEALRIHDAEAWMDHHPYHVCPAITGAYRGLIGLRIGAGFLRAARERFRGVAGCTHLSELIAPIATTAYQTLWDRLENARDGQEAEGWQINGCHALRDNGEVVERYYPLQYRNKNRR